MHVTDQVIQSLFHTLHQDQAQPADDDDDDDEAVWRWLALFEIWACLALSVCRCLALCLNLALFGPL